MKIKVKIIGHKKWVDNMANNLAKIPVEAMVRVMDTIKGRAQYEYLTGPYPEHLRVGKSGTGGHLRQQLQSSIDATSSEIQGKITVERTAYYGLIWEAVGPYSHRKGMFFANDTPMYRPFALPAYKDLADWTVNQLSESIVESAR